jgi:hypothetical protein
MRVVYLDKTGHSGKQPIAAAAGVVIDPDRHWVELADAIEALKNEVPAEIRPGFIFHATDLHYGGRQRDAWPDERRWSLLDKLVALPRQLGIPIAMGFTPKPDLPELKGADMSILSHAVAYLCCLQAANDFMVRCSLPNEVAMIVAEERPEAHRALRECQKLLGRADLMHKYLPTWAAMTGGPITRLKAPPAFASKEDEVLLQMADGCAFVFQRALCGSFGADRLLNSMFGAEQPDLASLRARGAGCIAFTWDN